MSQTKRNRPIPVRNATWHRAREPFPCSCCAWFVAAGDFFLSVRGRRVCMVCARTLPHVASRVGSTWANIVEVRQ